MNPPAPPEPRAHRAGVDAQNPWPGLAAFTEELREFFHGRAEEADELSRRVQRKSLTVLFGQSGLGKSSLLQAGLFPLLRAGGFVPVPIRLDHSAAAPPLTVQVTTAATRAILEAGGRPESADPAAGDSLWEHFHRRSLTLETDDGRPVQPVLVFDQFEELFAIGQASEESRSRAARFLTELADLVENRAPEALERRLEEGPELARQFRFDDSDLRVLVCLREDYLPHLEGLRQSMPSVAENRMRLTRMGGARALEAVLNPGGGLIAPEVGRQVVRFVAGERSRPTEAAGAEPAEDGLAKLEVEPSLLSLVCRELNTRRLELGLPRISADLLAGNRERILQDYYERCVADQPPAVRAFVEDELVTDSGLRENVALERARKVLAQRGAPAAAIDELVRRRLLHLEDRLDIQRVELTHDVLTAVVKRSRDERQQREATLRAEQAAQAVREKARRQRRRLGFIVAGMAAALIVVSGFGAFSFIQWQEAVRQREQSRRAREEALRAKLRAEESQRLAERRFDEKRQAMDGMLAQFSDRKLSGMPGTQPIRKALFERGVTMYESLLRERQGDATTRLSLAERYAELGRLRSATGTLDQALETLRRGERLLRRLVQQEPGNRDYRFRLGVILYQMGYCCWEHQQDGLGVPLLRESVRILAELAGREPKDFESALHLALARTRLSAVLRERKEREELNRVAYESLKRLVAARPKELRALIGLARAASNRGYLAIGADNVPEAEPFFEEARQLAMKAIEADATDQMAYATLQAASMGLGQVYGRTSRVARGIEVLTQVVGDLSKLAADNPAVTLHQQYLVWAHDELRKLYQRSGDYDKAVDSLQEIVRISEDLARRNPQNPQHRIDAVTASQGIADIYRNRRREPEAAVILDKVIKQAGPAMRQHPTSDDLLDDFLLAHQVRGEMALAVQQYEKAREAYQAGVDLFTRYRAFIKSLGERTRYNYFHCCRGLLQIAKQKKETGLAIDLARRLIIPIRLEDFTEGDYKQQIVGELITLSGLLEDTGNLEEALRLRVRAVEESRKVLGGDPKSNWYAYEQVFGAHQHLARLYRKTGQFAREFEAIRDYLGETEPYVRERDHSALLAETAAFTPRNLSRLREAFDGSVSHGGMKRFTIPTDFDGVKYPFHVYVAESWQFLDDQFTWVNRIRGGKVPQEVIDSFRRLYKIAKDNKVSYQDLCVYALSSASDSKSASVDEASPIVVVRSGAKTADDVVLRELAEAKEAIRSGKGGVIARRRLALKYARLAEDEFADSNYYRAAQLISEAREYIEVDAFGRLRHWNDQDVYAYIQYVQGAVLACTGEFERGYATVMESFQAEHRDAASEFAIPAGNREFALGWISLKLRRPVEAAAWYRRAMELGHRFAAGRVYLLFQAHPEIALGLPDDLRESLTRAKASATKDETAPAAFTRLVTEGRAQQEAREASRAAAARREEQSLLSGVRDLAAKYHDLAEVEARAKGRLAAYREALKQEFDVRGQLVKRGPTDLALKADQANVAARLARSYRESKETPAEVEWTERAAGLNHVESLLQAADWYEKGTNVKVDAKKAASYRYLGTVLRGIRSFGERRYDAALPDLKTACESGRAGAAVHNLLGMCYGKLGRWDEAVAAYTRGVEFEPKGDRATGAILNSLEALIIAQRPEQLLQLVHAVEEKGWELPKEGTKSASYNALFHGFRAIALRMGGQDSSEAERAMRQYSGKPDFKVTDWSWAELDQWLKTTKLAPNRKTAVEGIIAELKGPK